MHTSPFQEKEGNSSSRAEFYRLHNATLSGPQREYASIADGRLQLLPGRVEFTQEQAYMEVAVGGHLVIVKPERPQGRVGDGEALGGLRGDVLGFSRQARNRLIRMIARTKKDHRPIFATLTYPDVFDPDKDRWKRDIDVFGKRFRRKFPGGAMIWRLEFKERRSGENVGQIAPHFHLLVWGMGLHEFREFAPTHWYQAVGSSDEKHLRAGTSSERVRTWNGVMSYVSKYIAKRDEHPLDWTGRSWGVIGRKNMPWAVVVVISLSNDDAVRLVRLGRKFCKLNGKVLTFGLTWLMDCEAILDYLEVMQGYL